MRHFFDDIVAELPPPGREILTESYVAQLTTNRNDPMRVRLRENSVDRWSSRAPVRVYHSRDARTCRTKAPLSRSPGCGEAARR
jgi:hypothetical protein